jgi:hypothetical protein
VLTEGRRLQDFPEMVEDHNEAVAELEKHLVKYLKGGRMSDKRPTVRKGGFMGMGGEKKVRMPNARLISGRHRLSLPGNQISAR